MPRAHLRSIYEEIGAETIDELVNAFYPRVYSIPNLIPIFNGDIHEITPMRAKSWLRCMKEAFEETGLDKQPAGKTFYQHLLQVASIMVNTDDPTL